MGRAAWRVPGGGHRLAAGTQAWDGRQPTCQPFRVFLPGWTWSFCWLRPGELQHVAWRASPLKPAGAPPGGAALQAPVPERCRS